MASSGQHLNFSNTQKHEDNDSSRPSSSPRGITAGSEAISRTSSPDHDTNVVS